MIQMLFLLLAGHALADYPLQGDFMARYKSPYLPIDPDPLKRIPWFPVMTAHCLIHALAVYAITRSITWTMFEFIAHFAIDAAKCDGRTTFTQDQALHVGCKLLYVMAL